MRTILYREVNGCLLRLCLGQVHWTAAKRILRYLHGTRNMDLIFCKLSPTSKHTFPHAITSMIPTGLVDADFARDISSHRSCTGFIFFLAEASISLQTHQRPIVAMSPMEAEFMAACAAAQESLWLRQLLTEFGCLFPVPIPIYEDNKACLDYSNNNTSHHRTKHISIRYHFIRDLIQARTIQLVSVTHLPIMLLISFRSHWINTCFNTYAANLCVIFEYCSCM